MHEIIAVYHNTSYGDVPSMDSDLRKVIFTNTSTEHITITVVDPSTGVAAEATVRKNSLPDFVKKP